MPRRLDEGKKIGFKDAVEAALTLWKYRKWQPATAPVADRLPLRNYRRVDSSVSVLSGPQVTESTAVVGSELDHPVV